MAEKLTENERIKQRTLELYASLPDDEEQRKNCLDVRDELITLNYKFFGYVAAHTYIRNICVSYEDKFQSALLHFCEIWWKYKWIGSETKRGYRQDIAFGVFFKPRLSEMIERELVEVKYPIYRSLCMEAGEQLNKHWSKVRYEDLTHVNLPKDKMDSLKAIFGSMYIADLDQHTTYIKSPELEYPAIYSILNDKYDSLEDLLITEMIETEEKLTPRYLHKMADIYQVDFDKLQSALPAAEQRLYKMLQDTIDIRSDL